MPHARSTIFHLAQRSKIQALNWSCASAANCRIWIKRDDLLHPQVSGNKLFKLFHYLQQAAKQKSSGLISFGGAYSNHLYALARVAAVLKMPSVGVIRGDEFKLNNPTLMELGQYGMTAMQVDRQTYRRKMQPEFFALLNNQYPGFFVVPEGGAGVLGAQGFTDYAEAVTEQLQQENLTLDSVWLPAGTGTCVAGLAARWPYVHAVCALALANSAPYIDQLTALTRTLGHGSAAPGSVAWHGFNIPFGKVPQSIIECCLAFWRETGVLMDPIYGGKVLLALQHAFNNGLRDQRILILHTGGIQGWRGFFTGKAVIPNEFKDAVTQYFADTKSFILNDTDLTLGLSAMAEN